MAEYEAELAEAFANYEPLMLEPEKAIYPQYKQAWQDYLTTQDQIVAAVREGRRDDAARLSRVEGREKINRVLEILGQLEQINNDLATEGHADVTSAVNRAVWLS